MATAILLAHNDGDTTYENVGPGGNGTPAGAVRYTEGHTAAVLAAVIEEGTINHFWDPSLENTSSTPGSGHTISFPNNVGLSGASFEWVTDPKEDSEYALGVTFSGSHAQQRLFLPRSQDTISAVQGQDWTASLSMYGAVSVEFYLYENNPLYLGHGIVNHGGAPNDWTRVSTTVQTNGASPSMAAGFRKADQTPAVVVLDRIQIEQKDHETSFCPEYEADNTTLKPGFAWTGTANKSPSTRAAASITIPCTLPTEVAVRYSEDDGDTWDVAYVTAFTGNNVGTWGRLHHDGSNLVISSERRTLFGPVFAFSDTLTSGEQTTLETTEVWTFDLFAPKAPVVNAGPNAFASQNHPWTQAGSFSDDDSSSWTATVDYGDGGGTEPLPLTGKTFSLSHTYATPGTYTVTVRVTDDGDLTGTDTVQVTVSEGPVSGQYVVSEIVGTDTAAPVVTLP